MTSGPGEALAATSDPARLVPADLAGVRAQAAAWEAHADAVADVAVEVARVDIGGWSGAGKSAFVDACRRHVTRLRQTATAYREAASALTAHAHEIEAARRAAERAVSEWQRGEAATQASRREQEQARAVLGAGLLSAGPSREISKKSFRERVESRTKKIELRIMRKEFLSFQLFYQKTGCLRNDSARFLDCFSGT